MKANESPSTYANMKKGILLCIAPLAMIVIATTGAAQQRPPIRQLGPVVAKSAETFANVTGVRALSNGSVLVNDAFGRRVLMFEPQLAKYTVIADSTSATATAYGNRGGALVAYRGDSSLFIDPASVSMLVIDPAGKIIRVMAIPRAEDALALGGSTTAYDAKGRLLYRASPRMQMIQGGPRRIEGAAGGPMFTPPVIPDSALIFRVDLASRKVDTVGYIRTPKVKMEMKQDDKGNMSMMSTINPLPVIDDWAMLPDGSIAFVRGRDYHVDWVNADGTKVSSTKIPFDWQRLTDDDKVAFIDSVKAARERLGANAPSPLGGAGAQGGGGGGAPTVQIFMGQGAPGGGPPGGARMGGPAPQMNFIPANELPDYKPPFFSNSTRADTDGNLWIRTIPTSAIAGGPVYDVINRKGEIVERVQIPVGRSILGFGAGGAVYLLNRDGATATIERASVR
jgi:hypothetical protein